MRVDRAGADHSVPQPETPTTTSDAVPFSTNTMGPESRSLNDMQRASITADRVTVARSDDVLPVVEIPLAALC